MTIDARPSALLAAAGTGIQVGAAMVATRFAVDQAGPGSLAFLRYVVGVLCLLPFVLAMKRQPFATRDLAPMAALGIVQFGVLIALLNYALQHIPSARAALIFATFPLQTMLLSALIGRERLGAARVAGVALSFAGVAVALAGDAFGAETRGSHWLGTLAAFGSASCGAACSVLYRPYVARYPTLQVSAFAMFAAVLFLALLAANEGFFLATPRFTTSGWIAVLFIGFSSGIGYFLWLYALGNAAPTLATMFMSLSPVTAAIGGALMLGEPVSMAAVAGLLCVIAGLWLALRPG